MPGFVNNAVQRLGGQILGIPSGQPDILDPHVGAERVWIVHGADGLDELTTTTSSYVAELKDGQVNSFEITPEDAGLPLATLVDLKGGDAATNADAITRLLAGEASPYRDIVALNAGAALVVAGKAPTLNTAVNMAAQAINDGAARAALDKLIKISSGPGNG